MKIYVASSWRNPDQPELIKLLKEHFGEASVFDFRHPAPKCDGFHWEQIDPDWHDWTPEEYIGALRHRAATEGFMRDMLAMHEADVCVLLLPAGRSAHLEAGWMKGVGKRLVIITQDREEPELMYKLADIILNGFDDIVDTLQLIMKGHL